MEVNLIEVRNLTKIFETGVLRKKRKVLAVDRVSFDIPANKPTVLTLAGESGSGKTTIARLILGFTKPTSGEILYRHKNASMMDKEEWMRYRRDVQAVFQDPYGALNPFHKVDRILTVPLRKFRLAGSREEEQEFMAKALETVGLKVEDVRGKYPHQLSGGERQRIMLARAFSLKPRLIVTDEPVSMVDASLRADVLNIILNMKRNGNTSFLYITHDLSTARYVSDNIIIMYLGSMMEMGSIDDVILNPLHPYVQLLLSSVPNPDPDMRWKDRIELPRMELNAQAVHIRGCKFYSRCLKGRDKCAKEKPKLINIDGKLVACFLYE